MQRESLQREGILPEFLSVISRGIISQKMNFQLSRESRRSDREEQQTLQMIPGGERRKIQQLGDFLLLSRLVFTFPGKSRLTGSLQSGAERR